MYNVLVTLTKVDSPLPTGVLFGHTNLDVVDATGTKQSFSLSGSETPPWTVAVAGLADGASTYSAQDVDSTGSAIGSPVTATYSPVAPTYPSTNAITITPA